jgi:hypothetical protein
MIKTCIFPIKLNYYNLKDRNHKYLDLNSAHIDPERSTEENFYLFERHEFNFAEVLESIALLVQTIAIMRELK